MKVIEQDGLAWLDKQHNFIKALENTRIEKSPGTDFKKKAILQVVQKPSFFIT